MTYRLIDELGYEIGRGSRKRILQSCAMNYGSRIVENKLIQVAVKGWQERSGKTSILLVDQGKSTVVFHPELHTIK